MGLKKKMPKPWKRCKALVKLVSQINAGWPGRDTSSDGSIGDAEHASRSSDHNPFIIDPADKVGVVRAQDIDEDLNATTHSLRSVVDAIVASKDDRVLYIIYEGRICRSYPAHGLKAWEWGKYTGKNAHKHHAHISVKQEKKYWNDDREWSIGSVAEVPAVNTPENTEQNDTATKPADDQARPSIHVVEKGDTLWELSNKYQVSVSQIKHWNALKSDTILVGERLRVK